MTVTAPIPDSLERALRELSPLSGDSTRPGGRRPRFSFPREPGTGRESSTGGRASGGTGGGGGTGGSSDTGNWWDSISEWFTKNSGGSILGIIGAILGTMFFGPVGGAMGSFAGFGLGNLTIDGPNGMIGGLFGNNQSPPNPNVATPIAAVGDTGPLRAFLLTADGKSTNNPALAHKAVLGHYEGTGESRTFVITGMALKDADGKFSQYNDPLRGNPTVFETVNADLAARTLPVKPDGGIDLTNAAVKNGLTAATNNAQENKNNRLAGRVSPPNPLQGAMVLTGHVNETSAVTADLLAVATFGRGEVTQLEAEQLSGVFADNEDVLKDKKHMLVRLADNSLAIVSGESLPDGKFKPELITRVNQDTSQPLPANSPTFSTAQNTLIMSGAGHGTVGLTMPDNAPVIAMSENKEQSHTVSLKLGERTIPVKVHTTRVSNDLFVGQVEISGGGHTQIITLDEPIKLKGDGTQVILAGDAGKANREALASSVTQNLDRVVWARANDREISSVSLLSAGNDYNPALRDNTRVSVTARPGAPTEFETDKIRVNVTRSTKLIGGGLLPGAIPMQQEGSIRLRGKKEGNKFKVSHIVLQRPAQNGTMTQELVKVDGLEITLDSAGNFNLNDLPRDQAKLVKDRIKEHVNMPLQPNKRPLTIAFDTNIKTGTTVDPLYTSSEKGGGPAFQLG